MLRLTLSAAALALSAGAATAQVATDPATGDTLGTDGAATGTGTAVATDVDTAVIVAPVDFTNLIPGERITDADIYALDLEEQEWTEDIAFDAVSADWTVAGEVEELVLDRDGQVVGIVAEIDGGFLGLADRDVFLAMEDMRLVPEQLGGDRWAVVTRYAQEALQELPEVESTWFEN